MTRKLLMIGIAAVATYALGAQLSSASSVDPGGSDVDCDNGSLRGAYALNGDGSAGGLPFEMVGRIVFDGNGHLRGANTEVWNGSVDYGTYVGTYSVDSSCRGVARIRERHQNPAIPNLHRFAAVGTADGERFYWTLTDNSFHELGDGESPLPTDTITVSGIGERIQ